MRTRRSASSSSDPVSSSPKGIGHQSVLLQQVLHSLQLQPHDVVLDATLGGAGHARELIKELDERGTFIGFDADSAAVARAKEALADFSKPRVYLLTENFRHIREGLAKVGVTSISKALFDLGWSGFQLSAGRGFSFLQDEPLLMTYADNLASDTLTAEKIVNTWQEESLADVIYGWGEEPHARRIAKAIVERRKTKPFRTSKELADVIAEVVPRRGKIHPATKTFQALRIAVNDEFGALKEGLIAAWEVMERGGRLAVITFHSTEDREVKRMMREWEKEGLGTRVTKSPIQADYTEVRENPRSRSAKLRVIEKL